MTSVTHMLSKPAEQFELSALPPEFQTSNIQTSLPPCSHHAKDASLPIYERHTLVAFATLLANLTFSSTRLNSQRDYSISQLRYLIFDF